MNPRKFSSWVGGTGAITFVTDAGPTRTPTCAALPSWPVNSGVLMKNFSKSVWSPGKNVTSLEMNASSVLFSYFEDHFHFNPVAKIWPRPHCTQGPLLQLPRWIPQCIRFDSMHVLCLGVDQLVAGNVIKSLLSYEVWGNGQEDQKLLVGWQMFKQWAKTNGWQLLDCMSKHKFKISEGTIL